MIADPLLPDDASGTRAASGRPTDPTGAVAPDVQWSPSALLALPEERVAANDTSDWPTGRPAQVGPMTVVVHASDVAVRDRFVALFAAFPPADPAVADRPVAGGWRGPPGLVVDIRIRTFDWSPSESSTTHRMHELWLGPDLRTRSTDLRRLEDRVLRNLNLWVLEAEPELVHLHAGALARDGAVVLLVGPSGAGKSTLTTALVSAGWTYLSDEMIGVGIDDGGLISYPRPLTLKPGSWATFARLPSVPEPGSTSSSIDRVHIAPGELAIDGPIASRWPTPTLVLLVGHDTDLGPDALVSVHPVGVAATVEALVAESLDLERAGREGVAALVALATGSRRAALRAGPDLEAAVDAIAALVAAPPATDAPPATADIGAPQVADSVHYLPPGTGGTLLDPAALDGASTLGPSRDVHTWTVSDGGLLYDAGRGLLVRVDERAAALWTLLGDGSTPHALAAEMAAAGVADATDLEDTLIAFARSLAAQGLLQSALA
jgi:hypothetical protein